MASDAYWRLARARGVATRRQAFAHGRVVVPDVAGFPTLVESYHPSRQNTNTRRLTLPMLVDAFEKATAVLGQPYTKRAGGR